MTTSDLKIGQVLQFSYEDNDLEGEIVKLFKDPQHSDYEESDEHYYTYDVVVQHNGENFHLSADCL